MTRFCLSNGQVHVRPSYCTDIDHKLVPTRQSFGIGRSDWPLEPQHWRITATRGQEWSTGWKPVCCGVPSPISTDRFACPCCAVGLRAGAARPGGRQTPLAESLPSRCRSLGPPPLLSCDAPRLFFCSFLLADSSPAVPRLDHHNCHHQCCPALIAPSLPSLLFLASRLPLPTVPW